MSSPTSNSMASLVNLNKYRKWRLRMVSIWESGRIASFMARESSTSKMVHTMREHSLKEMRLVRVDIFIIMGVSMKEVLKIIKLRGTARIMTLSKAIFMKAIGLMMFLKAKENKNSQMAHIMKEHLKKEQKTETEGIFLTLAFIKDSSKMESLKEKEVLYMSTIGDIKDNGKMGLLKGKDFLFGLTEINMMVNTQMELSMEEELFTFPMVKFLKVLGMKEKSMVTVNYILMGRLLKGIGTTENYKELNNEASFLYNIFYKDNMLSTLKLASQTPLGKQQHKKVKTILQSLIDSNESYDFRSPVDWKGLGLLDYCFLIKNPMDLGTVSIKLKDDKYKYVEEVFDDIQLIWDNCKTYNPHTSWIYNTAQKLQRSFKKMAKNYLPSISIVVPGRNNLGGIKQDKKPTQHAIFEEDPGESITYHEKMKFYQKLKHLPPQEIAQIVNQIQSKCPSAYKQGVDDSVQILVENLDAKVFRDLIQRIEDFLTVIEQKIYQKTKSMQN